MDAVIPDEITARFLTQSGQFSRAGHRVKPGVFVPHAVRLDLSVSRVFGLSGDEIWPLGEPVAATHAGKLYGRAELPAGTFLALNLAVVPDEPPPRHANVKEWPPRREAQLLLAQKLAAEAILVLRE